MKKGDVCEGIIERYDFPNKGSFQVDERKVTIKGAQTAAPVIWLTGDTEAHADEIFTEAENRLHVQKAVLAVLLAGK